MAVHFLFLQIMSTFIPTVVFQTIQLNSEFKNKKTSGRASRKCTPWFVNLATRAVRDNKGWNGKIHETLSKRKGGPIEITISAHSGTDQKKREMKAVWRLMAEP